MDFNNKYFYKSLAFAVALLLLNISINTNFIFSPLVKCTQTNTANNIESLFELVVEVGLDQKGLVNESSDDDSPINEEVKVVDFVEPYSAPIKSGTGIFQLNSTHYPNINYLSFFEVNSPPPKV